MWVGMSEAAGRANGSHPFTAYTLLDQPAIRPTLHKLYGGEPTVSFCGSSGSGLLCHLASAWRSDDATLHGLACFRMSWTSIPVSGANRREARTWEPGVPSVTTITQLS